MQKMVWIIVFQLLAATVGAQYKEFPKLQKLFDAGKYDKCIKKAEKYAKNEKKELIPQVYLMKSWLAIGEDQSHKQNKIAVGFNSPQFYGKAGTAYLHPSLNLERGNYETSSQKPLFGVS